ncbi:hypothetical protein ACSMXM_04935 [Pacificimonas sp. ICDLI1SI03]
MTTLTRRAAIVGTSAAVVSPLFAQTASAAPSTRVQWDKALAAYRAANEHHDRIWDQMEAAEEAFYAARKPKPNRPQERFDFQIVDGEVHIPFTAKNQHEVASYDHRLAQWKRETAELERSTGKLKLEADQKQAVRELLAIEQALYDTPAPDLAAFALKMEIALEPHCDISEEAKAALLADAKRFANRNAA